MASMLAKSKPHECSIYRMLLNILGKINSRINGIQDGRRFCQILWLRGTGTIHVNLLVWKSSGISPLACFGKEVDDEKSASRALVSTSTMSTCITYMVVQGCIKQEICWKLGWCMHKSKWNISSTPGSSNQLQLKILPHKAIPVAHSGNSKVGLTWVVPFCIQPIDTMARV